MKSVVSHMVLGLLLLPIALGAQESEEVKALRKKLEEQDRKISRLMERFDGPDSHKEEKKSSWTDYVRVKGNFRYRYEFIDDDRKSKDRNRNRIRARLGVDADILPSVKLGFEISTGEVKEVNGHEEGDPISNNQTLSNTFSLKNLWVSQAYFDFHPDEVIPGLHVIGGKIHRPFLTPGKSEVIWDADVVPEGGIIRYHTTLDGLDVYANGYGFYLVERSGEADSGMFGGQAALKYNFPTGDGNEFHILGGGSYYHYTNLKGEAAFVTKKGNAVSYGNTLDVNGNYAENYHLWNFYGEVGTRVEDIPVAVFGDFVKNVAARKENRGWSVGMVVGDAKKAGSWKFRYLYKCIQKDAVFGAFTDSDFGGSGTNTRGHEVNFTYQLAKHWQTGVSYFGNVTGMSSDFRTRDFDRVQVDLKFKF